MWRGGEHRLEGQGCADVCLEFAAASLRTVCYVLFGPILKGYHSHNFLTTGLPPNLSFTHEGEAKLLFPLSFSVGEHAIVCPILPMYLIDQSP